MPSKILDGAATAGAVYDRLREQVTAFATHHGRRPLLATVLVGDDPASHTYVKMKAARCAALGMVSERVELPASTTTDALVRAISELSGNPDVDGILLQHPIPRHIDERAAFEAIAPSKDVDGVTRASFAMMAFGEDGFRSATPGGIMALLDAYHVPLAGRDAVVIGRSAILGRPVGMLLLARDATVTFCHSHTVDLRAEVSRADIVVAAVGSPELVKGDWIKPGAVVVDAGYNAGNVGDVEFQAARERASLITPVPGGVGPMTIATLLDQTLRAAKAHQVGSERASAEPRERCLDEAPVRRETRSIGGALADQGRGRATCVD